MNIKSRRKYSMATREETAAQTHTAILKAVGELWLQHSLHLITLEMVAEKAGTTVRTILRKFKSRDGLIDAAMHNDVAGIKTIKDAADPGNLPQIASLLIQEYELTGQAGLRTLAIENQVPAAKKVLKHARKVHAAWCARVFASFLPKTKTQPYKLMLGMFYAATDIYKWKLLRQDLGYSKADTEKIILKTLEAITKIKY